MVGVMVGVGAPGGAWCGAAPPPEAPASGAVPPATCSALSRCMMSLPNWSAELDGARPECVSGRWAALGGRVWWMELGLPPTLLGVLFGASGWARARACRVWGTGLGAGGVCACWLGACC